MDCRNRYNCPLLMLRNEEGGPLNEKVAAGVELVAIFLLCFSPKKIIFSSCKSYVNQMGVGEKICFSHSKSSLKLGEKVFYVKQMDVYQKSGFLHSKNQKSLE